MFSYSPSSCRRRVEPAAPGHFSLLLLFLLPEVLVLLKSAFIILMPVFVHIVHAHIFINIL